jgi:Kef-type K+ transport system membrane component KefB
VLTLYHTIYATVCVHAGIHAFFGAFIAGVIVPKDGALPNKLAPKIELVVRKSTDYQFNH